MSFLELAILLDKTKDGFNSFLPIVSFWTISQQLDSGERPFMSESGWSLKFFHHHPTVFSKYLHHIWMVMCDRLKAPGRAHFSFIKVTALLTQTNSSYRFRSTFYKDNLSYLLVITCPVPPFGLFGSKLWETAPACSRPFPHILTMGTCALYYVIIWVL